MFGNNTTSSWGNPQQQQQQQQPQGTGAFGQPSTFGSASTFGSGTFGQNTQQQPPANPMFGNLGGSTTTQPSTGGFGAFSSNNNAFGAKPATGFGAFGGGTTGTSTFGGGGAFGTNNGTTGTGAFGQSSSTGTTFGSTGTNAGTSLFGNRPAATGGFGAPSVSNNNADNTVVPVVTTGSSNPPFSVFSEKDTSGNTPVTLHYQSISMMPAYRGSSFEEIRYQDYVQGRKTAGGFGQTTFGLNTATTSNNVFGQPSNALTTTTQPATSTFGTFGTNNQNTGQSGFGTFGSGTTTQPSTGFGTFGQQNQQNQPAGTSTFGSFGQPQGQQPQSTSGGIFGSGAFGSNANKPAFGTGTFGTGGGFGGSSFGQNQQQQQPTGTGIFGQPQQQPAQNTGFGAFGSNTNNALKPAFGSTATTQPTSGFGAFGQNAQNQQQPQQPATGLFGNNTGGGLFGQNQQQQQQQQGQTQPAQPGTGLFGQQQQQQQPATGIFGNTGLFGNNQQQQPKPAFGGGLFGTNNNAAPGGQTAQPQGGLFGSTTQPAANTGGLFNRPAGSSIFGQNTNQPNTGGFGGSLFGNTLGGSATGLGGSTAGQGQGTLTASIAEPVSTNLPIFNMLPSGPRSVSLDPPPKKPSSLFTDVPTRSPLAMSNGRNKLGMSKLRGFGSSHTINSTDRSGNPFSATLNFSTSLPTSKPFDNKTLSGPDSLLNMSTVNGTRKISPKKLVLDKKIDASELFAKQNLRANSASPQVTFNPVLSAAAREREASSSPFANRPASATPTAPQKPATSDPKGKEKQSNGPEEGEYWVKPPLEVLRNMSNAELSSLKDLSVGRVGYGEVQFLDRVNLTTLPRLSELLGKVVQIENKECCVYPDSTDGDDSKPPPGDGINVRARITLLGCWPVDKSSREPIKDETNPVFARHLKKLKSMKHTNFESYDIKEGKWVFTVDHF